MKSWSAVDPGDDLRRWGFNAVTTASGFPRSCRLYCRRSNLYGWSWLAFLDRKDHRRVDPSASPGPGRGPGSAGSCCGIDNCQRSGMGDGLLAEVCDEEPPMRLEGSEAEDVTSGEVQRERGPTAWGLGVSCDA